MRLQAAIHKETAMSDKWKPISTFDSRMFSIMTNGTVDCTEVVKYKGYVPEWATHWRPMLEMPDGTEDVGSDPVFFRYSTQSEPQ